MRIADIGCGTGKLSRLFLENGYPVYGIEPDDEMRGEAQKLFGQYPDSRLVNARAEVTGLPPESVDLVCVGTAVHWFDPRRAKTEFARILRNPGKMLIIDNAFGQTPELAQFIKVSSAHSNGNLVKRLLTTYKGHDCYLASRISTSILSEAQMEFEEVMAYLLSLTTRPLPGNDGYEEMRSAVLRLFDTLQVNGKIKIQIESNLHYGSLRRK